MAKLMQKMSKETSMTTNDTTTNTTTTANTTDTFNNSLTPTKSIKDPPSPSAQTFNDTFENEQDAIASAPASQQQGGGSLMNFIFRGKRDSTDNNNSSKKASPYPPAMIQLPQVPDTMRQTDLPTDREKVETEIIKSLIESYFAIVRKNFIDMVPKTIMYFLVNHVRDAMQNELVRELYRDSLIPSIMKEAEDIAVRRRTCMEMRELLGKALEIVTEVRDFNTFK